MRSLPPGIGELEVNGGERTGRKQPRNFRAGIAFNHPDVFYPSLSRPAIKLARILLAPLQSDVANVGEAFGVDQRKSSGSRTDLELQRSTSAKDRVPVRRHAQA